MPSHPCHSGAVFWLCLRGWLGVTLPSVGNGAGCGVCVGSKCVFFDRDGIVNVSPGPGYVATWEAFHLTPEIPGILKAVSDAGFEAVLVTNQRGVARGVMTSETLDLIHAQMQSRLEEHSGASFLDIMVCTHHRGECTCRKPQPGMLLEAARRHGIDLAGSWMVGDRETDVEAGQRAGCRTILVAPAGEASAADVCVRDLRELENRLPALLKELPL